jgi:hypothetical protein
MDRVVLTEGVMRIQVTDDEGVIRNPLIIERLDSKGFMTHSYLDQYS